MENFYSLIKLVAKRLWHNLGLMISALIGIVVVLSIVVCVPVFSHAVSSQVLHDQLNQKVITTNRRLFSMHLYFVDTHMPPVLDMAKSLTVSDYIKSRLPQLMDMQIEQVQLELQSGPVNLTPAQGTTGIEPTVNLKSLRFLDLEALPVYSEMVEGQWPEPDTSSSSVIQVAIHQKLADEMFLNVGDVFTFNGVDIVIAGIWRPLNQLDPFWFNNPDATYADKLWVPTATYRVKVNSQLLVKPVFYASWYVIISDQSLHFQLAPQYARGLTRLNSELSRLMPGIQVDYSPLEALKAYQDRADSLTTLFYVVGAPIIVLALLFIGLTARIAVQEYEQETATLRGRGTSLPQIMGLNLMESLFLIVVSLPFAVLGGWLAAALMSKTVSFLKFTQRAAFPFSFEGINVLWLVVTALVIMAARFLPVAGITRTSIVRMKQEQSRGSKKPIWERFYLDFLLLIPGIYAFLVMRGWAKPASFLANIKLEGEQFRDPLLFIAPAVFSIAVCMITLRVVPLLVRLLAALVERLPGVWAFLSLEQIARRPQDHSSALLLIMISLSLSIYSASTAKTLDQWLYDSVYYESGADLVVHEYLVSGGQNAYNGPSVASGATTLSDLDLSAAGFVSIEDHLKLPTIEHAIRVAKYKSTFSFGASEMPSLVMGIDRIDFPSVAFWRDDFSTESLGALMNDLGADPSGVLVSEGLMKQNGLQKGDQLTIAVAVLDQRFVRNLTIVGTYKYFPTVYPSDDPTLIMNLESIFDNPDDVIGYNIWMTLRKDTDTQIVEYQLRKLIGEDRAVVDVRGDAADNYKEGLEKPERVGLFGVLNVGFLTTGLMPGIGFVLYSYASLRRRFIQLGILQAIGLSVKQLVGYIVSEQFLLMSLAILSGAGIGLFTSYLFVPFLQIGSAPGSPVPPFQVLVGWSESGWLSLAFGLVLFLTIVGTIVYLIRLKVFQAVKMGETL